MLHVRTSLLLAFIVAVLSVGLTAHPRAAYLQLPADLTGEKVLNAPYSAEQHFVNIERLPNGTTHRVETHGSEARDSKGRTYHADERLWVYLGKEQREMLYRIHDPVAHTDTRWHSRSKEVKRSHWSENDQDPAISKAIDAFLTIPYTTTEKLGVRKFGSYIAEGTRGSYTVRPGEDHNDRPIVVVHESWYCPELKIEVLEIYDDPRQGKTRKELVNIVRGEPDVNKYNPPADYVVHDDE
jgi:hypothetical protein